MRIRYTRPHPPMYETSGAIRSSVKRERLATRASCDSILVQSASGMMAAGWSAKATKALLSLSGERNIQSQLDGVVRNKLTARLHYRSIYKGSICFDLVQSSAPVYTVFTHGDEMVP